MKNGVVLILLAWFTNFMLQGQQQVVATAGDYNQTASGSLSWTLGEPVIETYTVNVQTLSQGFQQGSVSVIYQEIKEELKIEISVYPNPADDYVILAVDKPEGLQYQLYDIDARILKIQKLDNISTRIEFSYLLPSTYVIKVISGDKEIKSFKIVKQ